MDETRKLQLLKEAQRRFGASLPKAPQQPKAAKRSFRFLKDLFDRQLAFISSASKRKLALCGRRAGKTTTACFYLAKTCLEYPGCVCVFIAKTTGQARELLWAMLKRANDQYQLGITFYENLLHAEFPNGSKIILKGADKADDIETLRGGKYKLVILDECASIGPHIEQLVIDVLSPALSDQKGTICLLGTPKLRTGLFFEAANNIKRGKNFQVFRWTVLDNPKFEEWRDAPDWKERAVQLLKDQRDQNSWTDASAIYRREWLAEWNDGNDESTIYKFSSEHNLYDQLPEGLSWRFVVGADLGSKDEFAVVVCAFSDDCPRMFVVDCFTQARLATTDIIEVLEDHLKHYDPSAVVIDPAAGGANLIDELRRRYRMPLKAAEKTKKRDYIALLNSDFVNKRVLVKDSLANLTEQLFTVQWKDPVRQTFLDGQKDDACDALLYAYRECRHYVFQDQEQTKPKSIDEQQDEYFKRLSDRMKDEGNTEWWEKLMQ